MIDERTRRVVEAAKHLRALLEVYVVQPGPSMLLGVFNASICDFDEALLDADVNEGGAHE